MCTYLNTVYHLYLDESLNNGQVPGVNSTVLISNTLVAVLDGDVRLATKISEIKKRRKVQNTNKKNKRRKTY